MSDTVDYQTPFTWEDGYFLQCYLKESGKSILDITKDFNEQGIILPFTSPVQREKLNTEKDTLCESSTLYVI